MDYVFLDTTDSTNSYATAHQHDLGDMTMITAHAQYSGRGQRGNSWESAPGKNLTVTVLFRPAPSSLPMAERQFRISEATALAVADTLEAFGITASLKWPNDIYVADRKICGILIEHTLLGNHIDNSRIGIGLNVNQREFVSDAPNPESMARVLGRDLPLAEVREALALALERRLTAPGDIHEEYLSRLWRHDGKPHPFRRRDIPGEPFLASIISVDRDGQLSLALPSGSTRHFYFKEIEFIL